MGCHMLNGLPKTLWMCVISFKLYDSCKRENCVGLKRKT